MYVLILTTFWKKEEIIHGGYCSREGTNQRNTVYMFDLKVIVGARQLTNKKYINIFLKFKPSRFEGKTVNSVAKVTVVIT